MKGGHSWMISNHDDDSYDANNDHPWHHARGGNGMWVSKRGNQKLIKHIATIWFKMEDVCNFWRVMKNVLWRKITKTKIGRWSKIFCEKKTKVNNGRLLGPFIPQVALPKSYKKTSIYFCKQLNISISTRRNSFVSSWSW